MHIITFKGPRRMCRCNGIGVEQEVPAKKFQHMLCSSHPSRPFHKRNQRPSPIANLYHTRGSGAIIVPLLKRTPPDRPSARPATVPSSRSPHLAKNGGRWKIRAGAGCTLKLYFTNDPDIGPWSWWWWAWMGTRMVVDLPVRLFDSDSIVL